MEHDLEFHSEDPRSAKDWGDLVTKVARRSFATHDDVARALREFMKMEGMSKNRLIESWNISLVEVVDCFADEVIAIVPPEDTWMRGVSLDKAARILNEDY